MSETSEATPPSAVEHLPPSLQCRDCQSATVFMLASGQVKTYCDVMHLVSFDSDEPANLIAACSKHQPQE